MNLIACYAFCHYLCRIFLLFISEYVDIRNKSYSMFIMGRDGLMVSWPLACLFPELRLNPWTNISKVWFEHLSLGAIQPLKSIDYLLFIMPKF
jgi:hypothetical protein